MAPTKVPDIELETVSRVGKHVALEIAALCSTIPTPIHLTAVGTLSRVG